MKGISKMRSITIIQQEGETANNGAGEGGNGVSTTCYAAIVESWAKARIDGPMKVIERYDNSAKLLVTLGGFSPTLLVALYGVLRPEETTSTANQHPLWSVIFFAIFIVFFFTLLFLRDHVMHGKRENEREA